MRNRISTGLALALAGLLLSASSGASTPVPQDGVLVFSCASCSGAETGARLFTIRPDGTRLRVLEREPFAYEPRWSPDGRTLAFARGDGTIAISGADGSDGRSLTFPLRGQDRSPAWSPTGKRLAYMRVFGSASAGNAANTSLRTIDTNGTRRRFLLATSVGVGSPDWSPDGRTIAFSDNRERIWVVDADGKHRRRLGPRTLAGRDPRWSPDGTQVAFADVNARVLRVIDPRGSRVRTVFTGPVAHAWSPAGRRLAVMTAPTFECEDGSVCQRLELWIVDLAGSRPRLVFSAPSGGEVYGLDWRRGR